MKTKKRKKLRDVDNNVVIAESGEREGEEGTGVNGDAQGLDLWRGQAMPGTGGVCRTVRLKPCIFVKQCRPISSGKRRKAYWSILHVECVLHFRAP